MLNKKYIFTVILLVSALFACKIEEQTPVHIAQEMRTRACLGDVEGFYSYIDRASIEKNLQQLAVQKINQQTNNTSYVEEFKEVVLPSLIVLKWEVINAELSRADEGVFCRFTIISDENNPSVVQIVYPQGEISKWLFESRSGRNILVSIEDEKPFDFANLDMELGQGQIETANNEKSEKVINETDSKEPIDLEEKAEDVIPKQELDQGLVANDGRDDNDSSISKDTDQELVVEEPINPELEPNDKSYPALNIASDFGKARWGMTREQVIQAEASNPNWESPTSIGYSHNNNGHIAHTEYIFTANRLTMGQYLIVVPNSEEDRYLKEYENQKNLISRKFGSPKIHEENWLNSLYKDKPERHGFAVYIGHLSYKSKWDTERTEVLLELKSNNYNMTLETHYSQN
ncbi:MAG: hypothetical protein AAF462_02420 [Thermodesulfobacteriota bacterium]